MHGLAGYWGYPGPLATPLSFCLYVDLGRPILQHFDWFSRVFARSAGPGKYLGDVGDVDDVPLIIAATPSGAVVYETGNL